MEFINQAVTVLQTLVVALGAGLAVWGVVNLMEGYGNDNPGANAQVADYPSRLVLFKPFINFRFRRLVLILKNPLWHTNQIGNLRYNLIGAVFIPDYICFGDLIIDDSSIAAICNRDNALIFIQLCCFADIHIMFLSRHSVDNEQ